MALNSRDQKKIYEWLADAILCMVEDSTNPKSGNGPVLPLICKNCGYMVFFSAVAMGLSHE
jgi:hypothetical protein